LKNRIALLGVLILLTATLNTHAASALATPAKAAPPTQVNLGQVKHDVTYCKPNGLELKMDAYLPLILDNEPAPAILYAHGGGWTDGDKSEASVGASQLAAMGYMVASINYRLAPQHKWPAQIEDVKCAVRHLRANAATYRIDPNRIGVIGGSAGGHLAALAGLTGPGAGFEGNGGYPEQSSQVQVVVDIFGPTDFATMDLQPHRASVEQLLGLPLEQAADALKRASPITYVRGDAPPFFILHGDKDDLVPLSQSQELYDRLRAAGTPADLLVVKNAGHRFIQVGDAPISPGILDIGKSIADFFDKNLRTPPRHFPETNKSLRGDFLRYWQDNGGLPQQGYPISTELQEQSDTDGKIYTVQYFERAVFELHPENPPTSRVLLSLLGNFQYQAAYPSGAPNQLPNISPGSILFPETGKRLGGRFLQYWQTHGGLPQQGYPISEEFTETSALDGKPYTVQYFERAVFEYHPENPPPNDILLSQLGTFRYQTRYNP
jgi:acetyl esterase/lipase